MDQQKQAPPELKNIALWLRNKSGIKLKTGIYQGKRVDYFKGKSAIKALQSPAYAKLSSVPKPAPSTPESAIILLTSIIPHAFFLKVNRGAKVSSQPASSSAAAASAAPPIKSRLVEIAPQQPAFNAEEYYVFLFEGSQTKTIVGGVLMVLVILAGVMFPLWPVTLRIGVWYLSIGVLGLIGVFFGMVIFRLIFWLITIVVAKPGLWIFPRLFDDVGFVDSFIPGWDWDVPKKKTKPIKKSKKKDGLLTPNDSTVISRKSSKRSLKPGKGGSPAPAAESPNVTMQEVEK